MNRGLAHRPVFESRRDLRLFLSLLARKVRAGAIEVHGYALLTTHFHLLLRSPRGELSDVMMWVENQYVRRFNRRHGRDGPLFRGRFTSRLVDSETYWFTLVRYIDRNVVDAGLARQPADYPFCSAWHYARPYGPRWLARTEVERAVTDGVGASAYRPSDYHKCFGDELDESQRWMVERRIGCGSRFERHDTSWDDLIRGAPVRVRAGLLAQLRTADGRLPRAPLVDPTAALRAIESGRALRPEWFVGAGRHRSNTGWRVASVGVLREVSGLTIVEAAFRLAIDFRAAGRMAARHRKLVETDPSYAERVAELVASILGARSAGKGWYAERSTTERNEAGSE